jgi:hypothetical protein
VKRDRGRRSASAEQQAREDQPGVCVTHNRGVTTIGRAV